MLNRLILLVDRLKSFSCAEDKRNTPDSRKSNYCINYTAEKCILTAAYPCNYIKLKKSYASPVECADYSEYQRNSIHNHFLSSLSATLVVFRSLLVLTPMRFLCKLYFGNSYMFIIFFFGYNKRTRPEIV